MGTGQVDILLAGVCLVPLLLLAVLVAVYLLVRRWSQRSQDELKALGTDLRRLEVRYRAEVLAANVYSAQDPEPYGSRAATMFQQLDELGESMRELQGRRVELQEEANRLNFNRWQLLPRAPYDWFQLRGEIQGGARLNWEN